MFYLLEYLAVLMFVGCIFFVDIFVDSCEAVLLVFLSLVFRWMFVYLFIHLFILLCLY